MIIDPVELKQRYLQRIKGVRDGNVYLGPENVTLELTNACNLRCRFCITEHAPGNPAHFDKAVFLPLEKFFGIVADAVEMKVDEITIVGSGEPALHPSFCAIMRHLDDKPLFIKLYTNATFPLEYCDEAIKADHVIVNLSAINREHFQELQGKDLYDRVIANIERLVALRDARKPKFRIDISYVINEHNIGQKQEMLALAAKLGINYVDYRKMLVNDYNKDIKVPGEYVSNLENGAKRTPPSCLNGWFYLLVMSGGNFSNCYMIPELGQGNLDQSTFKQFWYSPQMNKIRLMGKKGDTQKVFKACQTCPCYSDNIQRLQAAESLR